MISIIIPVHNQATQITLCLHSILEQTEKDWELIIVNDGSTDAIEQVVENFINKNPNKKIYFFSKANEGSNPTRNFGFTKSQGEYVIFCDADIIMKPEMLFSMKEILEKNLDISFVYSSFYYGAKLFRLHEYSQTTLQQGPYIHTTSLIRRSDFPNFDPRIKRLQDWDLWLTMLENRKTGYWINKPLFKAQLGKGHFSQWLPQITYKIFPFLPSVKKYKEAVNIIKNKHTLSS